MFQLRKWLVIFAFWKDHSDCKLEDGLKEERLCPHGKIVEILETRGDAGDSGEWRKSRQIEEVF